MDITIISAYDLRESFLGGEVSALDIVKAFIDKIKSRDSEVNAYISLNEDEAIERAKLLDEKLASGEKMGSLAGIPISIKDNISTENIRTTCGSKMLDDYIPVFNASVINYIEKEDGIVLGKTNLDEFAMGSTTETSYYGPTKNPIANGKITGGSSGGSAVSVAEKMAPLSLGTDTGGSVRQPAAYCGVVGIKPSYGAISRFGVAAMASSLDQVGVIANNVRDSGILLKALMRKDRRDHTSYYRAEDILKDFDFNKDYDLSGMKIGLIKELEGYENDQEVGRAFDLAVKLVEKLGAEVKVIKPEYLKYSSLVYYILATAEASSNLARYDGVRYGYRSEDYKDLTDLYKNSRTEAFGDEIKKRLLMGTYLLTNANREDYYERALKIRRLIKEEFDKIFSECDLILTPTTPILPYNSGEDNGDKYDTNIFTTAVNLAGNCAISLPIRNKDKLSLAVQFIGNRFHEDKLLRAGLAFEGGSIDEL